MEFIFQFILSHLDADAVSNIPFTLHCLAGRKLILFCPL
jgi:hypothetical protein